MPHPVLDHRIELVSVSPTPIEPLDRLGAAIGLAAGALWVKRDDLNGLGGGGNKVRKLEYLCRDALDQGCDVLVTGGGRQSNHCRITAAAANRLGLDCTLVLGGARPSVPSGNVLLDELFGADIRWSGDFDYYAVERGIADAAAELTAAGRRPYAMPIGGASTIGAVGYVRAAQELTGQLPDLGLVVVATGSGGTHAGLAAGLGDHSRVLGFDVGARPDLNDQVPEKAAEVAQVAGLPAPVGAVRLDRSHFGAGYGAPTAGAREALDLAARTEGLILDPVYTAKAMAGLIAAARAGALDGATGPTVFLHTGGAPALFARSYAEWIRDPLPDPRV